jgi:V/A-type H+-transporting ATPase subunit I
MMKVMSICTIAWGVLTGNYFGILVPSVQVQWLTDDNNLMLLCFFIGAVHLTLAHGWNVIRYGKNPLALAQLGWICTTWVMFFLARTMILGKPFPSVMSWVFLAGAVLIAVFMTPLARIKQEWFNYVTLPLDLVSNFVDVVSYVRLYAVGMATYAVASAFNGMALDIGFGGLFSGLGAALILFLGHVLNLALATMGVLVHGLRLNALEFSGHLGLEWSGTPYNPFAGARSSKPARS